MTTVIDRRPTTGQPKHPDAHVAECGTCPGHCCKNDLIVLHPDEGDRPADYQTVVVEHPFHGGWVFTLDHKPNGDCVYLAEADGVGRCSIYARRPVICRTFDCGRSFAKFGRAERRRLIRSGALDKATLDMGRRVQAARASRKLQEGREGPGRPTLPATPPEGPRRAPLAVGRAPGGV